MCFSSSLTAVNCVGLVTNWIVHAAVLTAGLLLMLLFLFFVHIAANADVIHKECGRNTCVVIFSDAFY